MKIRYRFNSNSGVEQLEKELHEFLKDLGFMLLCGVIPPFSVLKDLSRNSPSSLGATNRFSWDVFDVTEEDYFQVKNSLMNHGMEVADVPAAIDTTRDWYIWQLEKKYGIPFDKHRELLLESLRLSQLLSEAEKAGSEEEINFCRMKSFKAARELSNFKNEYMTS